MINANYNSYDRGERNERSKSVDLICPVCYGGAAIP